MFSRPNFLSTRIEIDLDLLKNNYHLVKGYVSPAEVSVVVKGNAYGHGAVRIVKTLVEEGCKEFWVANIVEGIVLRNAGIKANINLLGGLTPYQLDEAVKYNLTPFIPDVERLKYLNQIAERTKKVVEFHLKIDSGLGRLGLLPIELFHFCEVLDTCKKVKLVGVGSHLALSSKVHPLNQLQYYRFKEAVLYLKKRYGDIVKAHLSGSNAVLRFPEMNFDMVRPGSIIFGLSHFEKCSIPIKHVLTYKTEIVQVKEVPIGWNVGYGENYALEPTRVALLPIGLVDGFSSIHYIRGNASVLIHNKECPIISIASDQMMVNLTNLDDDVKVGDEVVIIGQQGNKIITARELGLQAETHYAEILMKVSLRVPRLYYAKGELSEINSMI
jgi:alanine racemase